MKIKKSDDQMNIDKYRVAGNITEYLMNIFPRTILPKFMMLRQLLQVNKVCRNVKINFFKIDVMTFGSQI